MPPPPGVNTDGPKADKPSAYAPRGKRSPFCRSRDIYSARGHRAVASNSPWNRDLQQGVAFRLVSLCKCLILLRYFDRRDSFLEQITARMAGPPLGSLMS